MGLDVERLSARRVRELEPAVAPGVRSGLYARGDHQVATRRYLRALHDAAMRLQKPWATALAAGTDGAALQTTAAVLAQLRARLEQTR